MNKSNRSHRISRKNICTAVVAVVFMALLTGAILAEYGYFGGEKYKPDPNANNGTLPELEEELEETMQKEAQGGKLTVSINTAPVFQDGQSEGPLRIQNPESNQYNMRVRLVLIDSNKIIYESGIIKIGEYIEKDKLDTSLKKGEYSVMAVFIAVDPESGKEEGQIQTDIHLTVEN